MHLLPAFHKRIFFKILQNFLSFLNILWTIHMISRNYWVLVLNEELFYKPVFAFRTNIVY